MNAAASPGGLVVLRCARAGCGASKRWQWDAEYQQWVKFSYEAGTKFHAEEHAPANLRELADLLERVHLDPLAFIVRGELTASARDAVAAGKPILRRKLARGMALPTLEEADRQWIMLDIDKWPLPPWGDLADDPEAIIEAAITGLLPETFHDAECWWQLSSSAGFVPDILKVHLFFWLSEPASNEDIKARLRPVVRGFDGSPFSANQPHFIAAPQIEGGHDPLPRRTGWRKGLDSTVTLPELPPKQARTATDGSHNAELGEGIDGALALLGDGDGLRGFHEPLRTATMRYAQDCRCTGERDDATLKARLKKALRDAPIDSAKRSGIAEYLADAYLDRIINGAFAILATDAPPIAPHYRAPEHGAEAARAEVRQHVAAFLDGAANWHRDGANGDPDHAGLIVSTGIGKSTIARAALPRWIADAKLENRPHRVLWLVPTHKLGSESLQEMIDIGMSATAWRGGEADDPEAPGQSMCRNAAAVADARVAGEDPEIVVCGQPDKLCCEFRGCCGYQRQKAPATAADVIVAAHQIALHQIPKLIRDGLGLVVMDESWWQAGIDIDRYVRLATFADDVAAWPVMRDGSRPLGTNGRQRRRIKGDAPRRLVPNDYATAELIDIAAKVVRALDTLDDGAFVTRAAVVEAGLTADDCARAIKLEWRRKRDRVLRPGMSAEERKAAIATVAVNATLAARSATWTGLKELLEGDAEATGRLQVGSQTTGAGSERVVFLNLRHDLADAVAELPILLLDATLPVPIVRHFLPRLRVLADVRAAAPHQHVTQVVGGWGKTSLIVSRKATQEENIRRDGMQQLLRDFVALHGARDALVVTYQDLEDVFSGLPGIATGHFNAIAGTDQHRDVRALFVIGRPLPSPAATLELAIALTGRVLTAQQPRRESRGVLMTDGTGRAMNCRTYADPDLEAVRSAICDVEVVQAIGRARGVNRTADDPVHLFVLADVLLPLPVTRLVQWPDVRPDVVARMAARGLVLRSPTDAAATYRDLFPSAEAARKAMDRGDFPDISLWIKNHRGMSGKSVRYRPTGRGQQTRTAWCAEWRLPRLRDDLENLLGELALFEMAPANPPAAHDAAPAEPPAPALSDADLAALLASPPGAPPPEPIEPGRLYPVVIGALPVHVEEGLVVRRPGLPPIPLRLFQRPLPAEPPPPAASSSAEIRISPEAAPPPDVPIQLHTILVAMVAEHVIAPFEKRAILARVRCRPPSMRDHAELLELGKLVDRPGAGAVLIAIKEQAEAAALRANQHTYGVARHA